MDRMEVVQVEYTLVAYVDLKHLGFNQDDLALEVNAFPLEVILEQELQEHQLVLDQFIVLQMVAFITTDTSKGDYLDYLGLSCFITIAFVFSTYICSLLQCTLFRNFFPILLRNPLTIYQWTLHSFIPHY